MRATIAVWRLARATLHVLHGLWIIRTEFGHLDAAGRHARIRWWSAGMLRVLGIGLVATGTPRPGSTLLIANHISWLDIMTIHAVAPHARFVSKADVKDWPVIERERKRDALRVVHQMAEALRAGETVAVFPEGTTSDGRSLLPFHANLLQAAISVGAPVQPVLLRFADEVNPVSPAAEYVGETTLLQSLWRIASARGLVAHVGFGLAESTEHADRRALAEKLRADLLDRLVEAQAGQPSPTASPVSSLPA
ncbi:MAG: 1-acyl-sn-glycerol-3-phosphate acyltransferase [Ideonella sp.]|nr:1-acyl-sn-glycerol-3-phosphate acyltransferase [Ideonella sp.]